MPTGRNPKRLIYTTPFGLTSQFSFCGLPLRLDTYHGCSFRCTYCFARYRGGNTFDDRVRPADSVAVKHTLNRALAGASSGILAQFLSHRVPVHLGGMSDPFQPAETRFRVTDSVLRLLAQHRYPTVISTRSPLVADYSPLLKEIGPVVVQFSFSSTLDDVAPRVEPRCNKPSLLLRAMEKLAASGINVTCRWQPYIEGVSEEPSVFVARVASTGCRHVALEHLKVPLERRNPLWSELSRGVGRDLHADYKEHGAKRDGREFVLPAHRKLARVIAVARAVRERAMTFGAADNEFQHFSDTACCCSGVDQFAGFENWFRHQIGHAIRRSLGQPIRYDAISREWAPKGSIDRFLNSRSRVSKRSHRLGTLPQHVRGRWNADSAPGSPSSFYGVEKSTERLGGNIVYRWAESFNLSELLPSRPVQ